MKRTTVPTRRNSKRRTRKKIRPKSPTPDRQNPTARSQRMRGAGERISECVEVPGTGAGAGVGLGVAKDEDAITFLHLRR